MSHKICTRCDTEKPFSEFQIRRASKDGLSSACKPCLSAYDKSRANNPDRVKARTDYHLTDRGKSASTKAKKRFAEKYPLKRKAHIIVGNFLRDGKLIRPACCQNCDEEKPLQAHHCDYTKPLDVMWLCTNCHVDWHKHNTPIYSLISTQPALAGLGANYG